MQSFCNWRSTSIEKKPSQPKNRAVCFVYLPIFFPPLESLWLRTDKKKSALEWKGKKNEGEKKKGLFVFVVYKKNYHCIQDSVRKSATYGQDFIQIVKQMDQGDFKKKMKKYKDKVRKKRRYLGQIMQEGLKNKKKKTTKKDLDFFWKKKAKKR